VVLRIDPTDLPDPDLEVRWEIERMLKAVTPTIPFVDDGYGFARNSQAMMLSYATSDPDRFIAALVKILDQETVLGNRLGPVSMVGLTARTANVEAGHEFDAHRIVYPSAEAGQQIPD
jgi:hypothetical protein